jgi:hypothetical protein
MGDYSHSAFCTECNCCFGCGQQGHADMESGITHPHHCPHGRPCLELPSLEMGCVQCEQEHMSGCAVCKCETGT